MADLGVEDGAGVEVLVRDVGAQADDVLGPRAADVPDVIGVDGAVAVGIEESDVPGSGIGLEEVAIGVYVAEDFALVLENSIRLVPHEVAYLVPFGHACDGRVANGPSPTVEVTGFTGDADDFILEVRVRQLGVPLQIAFTGTVAQNQVNPLVAYLTEVGSRVVGGTDVARNLLRHEQVFCGLSVEVRFNGEFVVKESKFDTDIDLLTFLPFHIGVGRRGEGSTGVQGLGFRTEGVGEYAFNAADVAQRRDAVRAVDPP